MVCAVCLSIFLSDCHGVTGVSATAAQYQRQLFSLFTSFFRLRTKNTLELHISGPIVFFIFHYFLSRCHVADEACLWTGLTSLFTQAEAAAHNSSEPDYRIPFTNEQKSIIYYYVVCTSLNPLPAYCPSACFGDPCGGANHNTTEPEPVCTHVGLGVHDFRCECPATWRLNGETNKCDRHDICEDKDNYPCVREHTENCNLTEIGFKCKCLMEYMGDDCAEKRNACIRRRIPGVPSGHDTCGYHGACLPLLGTDIYACECAAGYTDDLIGNDYPDCSLHIDPCGLMPCIHGECINLYDGNPPTCQCQMGYDGSDCSSPVASWKPWQAWTSCTPECGENRVRSRQRECHQTPGGCSGNHTEVEICAAHPCPVDGAWSDWGAWSDCPEPCGGDHSRSRDCLYNSSLGEKNWGVSCPGPSVQTELCPKVCVPVAMAKRRRSPDTGGEGLSPEEDIGIAKNDTDLVVEDVDTIEYYDDKLEEEGGLPTSAIVGILIAVMGVAGVIVVLVLKAKNKTDDSTEATRTALLAAKLEQEGQTDDDLPLPTKGKKKRRTKKSELSKRRQQLGYTPER